MANGSNEFEQSPPYCIHWTHIGESMRHKFIRAISVAALSAFLGLGTALVVGAIFGGGNLPLGERSTAIARPQ